MENSIQFEKIDPQSHLILIELTGSLDTVVSRHLQEKVNGFIRDGFVNYIVNFEHIEDISSAGIGVLSGIALNLRKYDGKIVFVNVPEKIFHVFKITRLIEIFYLAETVEKAIAVFHPIAQAS